MNRFMWFLVFGILIIPVFLNQPLYAQCAGQTNCSAASCTSAAVQSALNSINTDGTTLTIPSGTCHWSSGVSYTQTNSFTLMGAGSQGVVGGGDATVILDDISGSDGALRINTITGKSLRLSAITFEGGSGTQGYNGAVQIIGYSQQVRIDHVHFRYLLDLGIGFYSWEYGVVDHSLFDLVGANNGVRVEHANWNSGVFGNSSWADSAYFGTNQAIYMEDNTFNCAAGQAGGCYVNDSDNGGHMVFRYNTVTNSYFQNHDQTGDDRGPRAFELYNNSFTWNGTPGNQAQAAFLRGGTGLVWGNVITKFTGLAAVWTDRATNSLDWGSCPVGSKSCSNWGYCGTAYGPSAWDGNNDSSGYACMDQIGRGKGDLLTGTFPNKIDSVTGTVSWANQAIEPVYEWNDAWTSPGYGALWSVQTSNIKPNRDYYLYTSSFNGTSGVGSGALSSRPSTCTPLVAYWATDTSTLYQCSATNTWSVYYQPYTYPHPLQGGGDPQAPSGLQAVVQ